MSKNDKGITPEQFLEALKSFSQNPEIKQAMRETLGFAAPRERLMAYRSKFGNAFLSIRQQVGESAQGNPQYNYITLTSGKTGFHLSPQQGNRGGFRVPQPVFEFEMDKKGQHLTATTTIDIGSDEERDIITKFLSGKLDPSTLPEAPNRGRPSKDGQTTQTTTPAPTQTKAAPTKAAAIDWDDDESVISAGYTPKEIKMANALVKANQAKNREEAFSQIRA